jgi:hypothetical protein
MTPAEVREETRDRRSCRPDDLCQLTRRGPRGSGDRAPASGAGDSHYGLLLYGEQPPAQRARFLRQKLTAERLENRSKSNRVATMR